VTNKSDATANSMSESGCQSDATSRRSKWLAVLAVAVLVLTMALRLTHAAEIPAGVAYEMEAAYRMQCSQCPYTDFYFDQFMPVVVWRMLTLALAAPLALLGGASPAAADVFYNFKIVGLASVLLTAALTLFSFALLYVILFRFTHAAFSRPVKWLIMGSFALANLAVGFEFGEQQHLFVLLFVPYLLVRYLESSNFAAIIPRRLQVLVGLMAALGASFNIFCLFLVFDLWYFSLFLQYGAVHGPQERCSQALHQLLHAPH